MPMLFPTRYIPAESVTYLRTADIVICIGVQILIGTSRLKCCGGLSKRKGRPSKIHRRRRERTGEKVRSQPLRLLRGRLPAAEERAAEKNQRDLMTFTDERLKANAMNLFFEGTESTSTTITNFAAGAHQTPRRAEKNPTRAGQHRRARETPLLVGQAQPALLRRHHTGTLPGRRIVPCHHHVFQFQKQKFNLLTFAEETTIEGYKIPKRSVIVSNLYSIHFDPKLYPNPEKFDPKRFLNDEGKRIKMEGPFLFGLGKRACIGESLAQMEIFLLISSLLQSFTMPYAKDTQSFRFIPRE
ncbi:cytochrome P450 2U1 [Caerostris darwini]|uniref:Cytochrome P450 2U1 n=1 Tax=Caerostris darwini TaxID=1538125 RepID=A0AAV4URC9_9ARAC|nr:cytochrome P450 2U1 [Caerostris darwini]